MIEKPVASGDTTPLMAAEQAPASPANAPPATNATNRQVAPSMPSVAATNGASRSSRAVRPSAPSKSCAYKRTPTIRQIHTVASRIGPRGSDIANPASPLAPPVRLSACTTRRLTNEARAKVASAK
jgi:hypothetical protein